MHIAPSPLFLPKLTLLILLNNLLNHLIILPTNIQLPRIIPTLRNNPLHFLLTRRPQNLPIVFIDYALHRLVVPFADVYV